MKMTYTNLENLYNAVCEGKTPIQFSGLHFAFEREDDEQFFTLFDENNNEVAYICKRFADDKEYQIIHDIDAYVEQCRKYPDLCESVNNLLVFEHLSQEERQMELEMREEWLSAVFDCDSSSEEKYTVFMLYELEIIYLQHLLGIKTTDVEILKTNYKLLQNVVYSINKFK